MCALAHVPHQLAHPADSQLQGYCSVCEGNIAITATGILLVQAEGLKDKTLEQELIPVQKGVVSLAKAGAQLEAGNVRDAASTLSESWVAPFDSASAKIGGAGAAAVATKLGALKVLHVEIYREH